RPHREPLHDRTPAHHAALGPRPRAAPGRRPDAGLVRRDGPRARRGGTGDGGDDGGGALRRLPAPAGTAPAHGQRGLAAALVAGAGEGGPRGDGEGRAHDVSRRRDRRDRGRAAARAARARGRPRHRNARARGTDRGRPRAAGPLRLAAVVSRITAFGRPPELHRAPVALNALLDECVSFAQARITTEGIEIFRIYDPTAPSQAMLDARELRKAFLNLVLNGLESLAPGGRLTVTTAWAADAKTLTVTIEDTGGGMSDETLSRIFDLFFTTKPQGTGLGMAIARSVIDLHGGELAVHS